MLVAGVDANNVSDRNVVLWPSDDSNLVSCADVTFSDDTEVGARPACLREALGKARISYTRPELPAWNRRCCTARRKSLTSLCRSESHPAQ